MISQPPFLIISLPRSRSAWLSYFLSYGGQNVGHDTLISCPTIGHFVAQFQDGRLAGSCETGAMLGWRLIKNLIPGLKIILIRRSPNEVRRSLWMHGVEADGEEIYQRDVMLDLVEQQPGVLSFDYEDLRDPDACAKIFEHCLGLPFDWEWWTTCANVNIQVQMGARLELLANNAKQIAGLKSEVIMRSRELEGQLCLQLN